MSKKAMRQQHGMVVRTVLLISLMHSIATVTASSEQDAADPTTQAGTEDQEPVAELPPLDCKPAELLEKVDTWSVDCVAMWLENIGIADLRSAFVTKSVDGNALKGFTLDTLAKDFAVDDEEKRKKIYYNLKDVLRKDNSTGNTNHYSQMFFWFLPFLGIYKYLSAKCAAKASMPLLIANPWARHYTQYEDYMCIIRDLHA